jgi:hypothetical protein
MKKLINLILALMLISSTLVYSQENPDYAPFSTSCSEIPLIQNYITPPSAWVDKSHISFDLGPINQSGYIDLVTTYSIKFLDYLNNQYSGNKGYWNVNSGGTFNPPSGPYINENELSTGPGYYTNDNSFINLRQLSLERKDLAVVKDNGLYVYRNDNNAISSSNYQYISGGVGTSLSVGNFNRYNSYEDALIINGTHAKVYTNDGYGQLYQTPSVDLNIAAGNILKAKLARVFNQIYPYNAGNSAKSDIIIAVGQNIYIYKNNSDNTVTYYQTLNVGFTITDFELSDISRRGWNDLIVVGNTGKMKVFLNNNGAILSAPIYDYTGNSNYIYNNSIITTADLGKTGFKDIIVATSVMNGGIISVFQNSGYGTYFNQTLPQQILYVSYSASKIKTFDADNRGGIALVLSKTGGFFINTFEMFMFNPSISNTIPQPPITTKDYYLDGSFWRPRIHIDKNNVRDFNHFELFKKSHNTNNNWVSLGQVSNDYVDYTEFCIISTDAPDVPRDNCFYYAKSIDNTNLVSNPSNSVSFSVGINNPNPIGVVNNDNMLNGNQEKTLEVSKTYSVSNFPNPFNPVTNIFFNLPKESKVTIKIYNSLGQEINILTDQRYGVGNHVVEFNAGNLPSGIYFYRITAGEFTKVNRLMLIK